MNRRPDVARRLVERLGGRFSTAAGIDVDAGSRDVERWFLAATLFGTRIRASMAIAAYRALDAAGIATIADAGRTDWDRLVAMLDAAGYARYDFRTATRLHALAGEVARRHPHGMAEAGADCTDPTALVALLGALPGWGPVTVGAFLRELRGVWPAADPPVERRTCRAADHLTLGFDPCTPDALRRLAASAAVDARDLEAALVRLALAHERGYDRCRRLGRFGCDLLDGEHGAGATPDR